MDALSFVRRWLTSYEEVLERDGQRSAALWAWRHGATVCDVVAHLAGVPVTHEFREAFLGWLASLSGFTSVYSVRALRGSCTVDDLHREFWRLLDGKERAGRATVSDLLNVPKHVLFRVLTGVANYLHGKVEEAQSEKPGRKQGVGNRRGR